MKKYLIAFYFWQDMPDGQIGSGVMNLDMEISEEVDIYTSEGINSLIEYVKEKHNYRDCVILNIIPLLY